MRPVLVTAFLFKSNLVGTANALPTPDDTITLSAAAFFRDGDFDPNFASITPVGTAAAGDVTYQIVWPSSGAAPFSDITATLIEGTAGYTFEYTFDGTTDTDMCTLSDNGELAACVRVENGQPTITGTQGLVAFATVTLAPPAVAS
ncbi:hypothetical protein DFH09DRAFT_1289290, partial [Mycena vulgaris]